jgi:hypothetical protein
MIHSRHRIVVHTINLHFELIINNDVFDDFKRCCQCFSKIVPRLNSIDFLFLSYAWRWNLWIDFEILHYIKISLFDLAAFILFQELIYCRLIRYLQEQQQKWHFILILFVYFMQSIIHKKENQSNSIHIDIIYLFQQIDHLRRKKKINQIRSWNNLGKTSTTTFKIIENIFIYY